MSPTGRAPANITVCPDDDLRVALGAILSNATDALTVSGNDGKPVGTITLADVQRAINDGVRTRGERSPVAVAER